MSLLCQHRLSKQTRDTHSAFTVHYTTGCESFLPIQCVCAAGESCDAMRLCWRPPLMGILAAGFRLCEYEQVRSWTFFKVDRTRNIMLNKINIFHFLGPFFSDASPTTAQQGMDGPRPRQHSARRRLFCRRRLKRVQCPQHGTSRTLPGVVQWRVK